MAPVAAWADQVRYRFPGTGAMHYVNGKFLSPSLDVYLLAPTSTLFRYEIRTGADIKLYKITQLRNAFSENKDGWMRR